jgi:4-cresol dehydrogenase (hydroxylating) flavoprotein subunit
VIAPPGVSEEAFARALEGFVAAVGTDAVLTAGDDLTEFRDPYASAGSDAAVPSAALLPESVEHIQAILRVANQYLIPLWTVSQGRNYGYGGSAPRVGGSVVLCLRRMNRVLEIDEECAYAVVEPGVRFFDLYEAVRAGGHALMVSVPDLGWGSVIGNTLDHGFGYTVYGDHASSQCGMEVVLANGDVIRTGMGAMTGNRSWHVHKRGFGPSADGLFMQSNFGIVTKMGVWLMPTPECYVACGVGVEHDADLEPLIETLRPLLLERVIPNYPVIANALTVVAASTRRDALYQGLGPVPPEIVERARREGRLGAWNARFALYGREAVVDAQLAIVEEAFAWIPGAGLRAKKYSADALSDGVERMDFSQAGIPSLDLLDAVKWRGGEEGGHLGFSPVAPLTGRDARAQCDLLRPIMERRGFDYVGGIILTPRSLVHVFEFVYDTKDEQQVRDAHAACREMVQAAAGAGYGEYRAHLDVMDLVAEQYDWGDHALRRFNETIKDVLDPNGILSPGKQGIWPSSMRPR